MKRPFLERSAWWTVALTIAMAASIAGIELGIEAFRASLIFSAVMLAPLVSRASGADVPGASSGVRLDRIGCPSDSTHH